jgi:hypothetical protein
MKKEQGNEEKMAKIGAKKERGRDGERGDGK